MERLYVDVASTTVRRHVAGRYADLRLGAGLDYSADMGSLTSRRRVDPVVAGTSRTPAKGRPSWPEAGPARLGPLFYEPTVLTGVDEDMACAATRLSARSSPSTGSTAEDEAIRRANHTPYGLNAERVDRDVARGRRIAERLKAGTVDIDEGYGAAFASYGAHHRAG